MKANLRGRVSPVARPLPGQLPTACRGRLNARIENLDRRVSVTALRLWLPRRRQGPGRKAQCDREAVCLHPTGNRAGAMGLPAFEAKV